MNKSIGSMTTSFLKRRRSFLMAMMGSWLAAGVATAQVEQKPAAKGGAAPQKSKSMKKYTMVVLTNPVAGKEDQFNDWYTHRHVNDVVAIPGFVSAQRFKMVSPLAQNPWRYCAIYEMETDDPNAVVQELIRRNGTDQLPSSDAMDPNAYAVVYEELTPVVLAKKK